MATSDLATSGGFERGRYFSRAWFLLTREKGWWKPVAVCAAADLVPVAGPLGVLGYKLEWARLVAWGADVSPKRHGVRVGSCISSGWRGFLVLLVWSLVMGVIGGVCGALPLIGGLLSTLWTICCLYLGMVVSVATLRATIYQKAGAGFSWKNLVELGRRDPSGLLSILGWEMLCYLVIALVSGIVLSVTALGAVPRIISLASELGYYNSGLYGYDYGYGSLYGGSEYYVTQLAMELFFYVIAAFGPTLIVLGLIALVLRNGISMVVYAALGLWIRQFDVANWGRSEEPLPRRWRSLSRRRWSPRRWQWSLSPWRLPRSPRSPRRPSPSMRLTAPRSLGWSPSPRLLPSRTNPLVRDLPTRNLMRPRKNRHALLES